MRSNVRKMWTALLAVLFAVAVGFGLWFAFAPAARPANVHAAEEPSVIIQVVEQQPELKSYEDPSGDLISARNPIIKGTVTLPDGTNADLTEYSRDAEFRIYIQETGGEPIGHFRPLASDTGATFTRYLQVGIKITGYTDLIYSNRVPLTITKPNSVSLSVSFNGGSGFDAGTSLGDVNTTTGNTLAEDRLVVSVVYDNNFSTARELSFSDEQEYGSYWVTYPNGKDQFEYSKDEQTLKIHYQEGGETYSADVTIYVDEAFITAPTPEDSSVELVYNGKSQGYSFLFYDDNTMQATPSGGTGAHEEDKYTVSVIDAGDYSIKFSAKSGYRFQTLPPSIPKEDIEKVGEKIIGVTYHFTIHKATIGSVKIDSDSAFKDLYTYDDDTITPPAKTAITMTPETTVTLPEDVEALTAEWAGAELTYTYTGINGTAYGPSSTLPENAGEYSWTVKISGMKNFNDFTGSGENGGAGSFTIQKKSLSVPALTNDKPFYTGEAQSATATYEEDLMSFDGDLEGEERINVGGYHATFTLTDPDNYKWEDGAVVSGEKNETATVIWKIVQAENQATVSLEDWTYGNTANSPVLTADFGADTDTVTYFYEGQTNAGVRYDSTSAPTEAGSYTVTATIEETKNYKGATANDTFEVLRAPIGLPSFTQDTFSYNGQNQTPKFLAEPSGFTHDLAAKKDAGSYTVTATLDGNHQWSTEKDSSYVYEYELTWTIVPVKIGTTGSITMDGWIYGEGGEAKLPSGMSIDESTQAIAKDGGDTLTGEYLYYTSNDSSAQPLSGVPTDAGSYWVRYHAYSDTTNFTEAYSDLVSFTIAQKEVTVSWRNTEFTYNGTVQTPTAETSDFEPGDVVSLTVMGGQTDANKDGATYTATASLAGTDKDNYVLKAGTATTSFSIARLTVEIVWGETAFTYDGESHAPAATVGNKVGSDDVSLTVSGAQTNAGTYTAKASLVGTDADNYALPEKYTTGFVINKAKLSVGDYLSEPEDWEGTNANDRQIEFSGDLENSKLIIDTSSNLFSVGDRLDAAGEVSTDTSVGQYAVTLTLTDPDNYEWVGGVYDEINGATITVKYWITQSQFSITVGFNDDTWTYGGTAGTPSIAVNISGGTESFEYYATEEDATNRQNALGAMPTDAGKYWVVGIVAATDDYARSVSAPVSFTINKVTIGITWGSETSFTYDGTPQAPTATATGAVNGEVLTLMLEGQATSVGTYTATVTGITINGEAATNYQLPADGLTKGFTITQRAISVTLNEYTVTYNGETFSGSFATSGRMYKEQELFAVEEGGLCGSDTLEGTFTYLENAINAGSYAWGKITWSNTNYSVNVTNRTEKVFTIDPAPITVKIENKTSVYGEKIADLTYTVSGTLYDNANTIFSLSTEATSTSNVGLYDIEGTDSGLQNSGNYDVKFVDADDSGVRYGTYTVTRRPVKIVLNDSFQSIYGTDITKSGTLITESGLTFVSGVTGSNTVFLTKDSGAEAAAKSLVSLVITGDGSYSATSDAGTEWMLTASLTAQTEVVLQNYTFEEAESKMTVKPRPITVEISDVSVTYGTAGTLGVNSVSYTGGGSSEAVISSDLAGGDGAEKYAKVFTLALYENNGGTLGKPIDPNDYGSLNRGEYLISLTKVSKNYEITFEDATYTVNAQSIGVILVLDTRGHKESSPVFDGLAWKYLAYGRNESGGSIEEITFHVTYYHGGDKLNGAPVNAGSYYAVVDTVLDEDGNYIASGSFSVPFTIAQREVSVTWTESTFTYNGKDQFDFVKATYLPWENGSQVKESKELSITTQTFKDWREEGYTFTATFSSDLEKQNYTISGAADDGTVSKTYQMNKAPITISVSSPTFTYGDFKGTDSPGEGTETDELTYKVSGLYGSDSVEVELSYSQNESSVEMPKNVGIYTVSATIAEYQNYTLDTVTPGTLTIEKKALTVTVDGESIEYGEDAPNVYDVTLTGALPDEEDAIKKLLTFDTSAYSAGYIVGNYTVKASFGADEEGILGNYEYTVTDDAVATCTLKVTQRKITVNIQDVTTDYGTAGTLTANVTREDGTTNNAILDQDLVKKGGQVVSGIAQFANVFMLSLDNATLDRLLNVGEYTIVGAAVTTGGNARGGNYDITFKSEDGTGNAGLYTVDPYEVTVNFEVEEHNGEKQPTYDGTAWKYTATAEGVNGETVFFQVTYAASEGSSLSTGGFAVNAGSYTVSVSQGDKNVVAEGAVSNYIVETDQSEGFTIEKRTLTLEWAQTNIATEDGNGTNTTKGYNSRLMELVNYTTGTGMTAPTVDADGELKVTFTANGRTTYYVQVELIDPLNYAWPENSTNVSGENGKDIQISFSVNATTNNITFGLSGPDGSVVTEVSGTYGEEFKVYIAKSEDDSPAGYNVVVYIDSIVKGDADTDYYYRFARDEAGITADTANTLKYDLLVDDLTTAGAGTYWMQVFALTDENSEYGIGRAYVKVTIGKKTITQDEINAIGFTTEFVYNGKEQKPVAIDLPEYLKVTFLKGATDVTEGTKLTATFTIVGNNCEFADSAVSLTRDVTIEITPYVITEIYWDENPSFTYNGTDQSGDVFVYFVDVNGRRAKLTATTEGEFLNAGAYIFTAQVPAGGNYKFQDDLTITNTITMAKATVEIGIGDAEAVYTGEPIEIDQTQYALRTAISLSDPEILAFLNQIHLIAVDDEGNPAVNAGEYQITLEKKEWAYTNIEIVFNDSYAGQLTVSPAPREVPVLDETQFVYNGTVQKPNVTGVDGVYTVENEGGTDVGTYSVTFTLVTENYYWATEEENVDTVTLYYEIVQAEYSFAYDVSDTVYNGEPVSVNTPELPAGETGASVDYLFTGMMNGGRAYSSSDEPTEAGSYTVRVTISGMKNYKDAEESAEFTIERAPIEVLLTFKPQVDGGNGWVYGTTPEDIYELDERSNPGGGGVTETYSTGSWSGSAIPTEVGEYTLTVTVAETNNYESGSASVEFKIVQASEDELSFTVSIEGWTYGEEPHAPSVIWGDGLTGHPDQISPVYTYAKAKADGETYSDEDFSSTVPTNAGSYVVKATFAETDHYGELSAMCKFTIGKAAASIDTSGVKTNFTYNGRAQAVGGAVLNHSETTLVYSPASVTAVGSYTVTISAAETANYSKVSVTVTVTVSRASAGFSVSIDDWTYGETPSRYTISGGSGGSVSVTYSGTTNAGVKYSSSKAPTEAGEYTITVVMGASGNFLGGTARDSFTIHRAKAEAELSLAGWMYGEEPNAYVLTPEFLRGEVVRVIYTDGTYYSEAVPKEVGSYTITVIYAETDNYLGGEVSCKFSIVPYGLGLTVTLEGWTYGDKANEPVVTGAGGIGLMYAYTGTANDGTVWNSNTAPEKAGSYTLTVTVIEAGNYTGESASTDFVIARRLLSAPAWDEEGMRELIEVCSGARMTRAILGFDMSLMNAQSATAQFMFDGTGAASVTANIHGVYTIVVSLRDAANYGWADLNEGETLTGPVTLTWTLTERVISLLWLIILLAVLIVIALIVLIVLLKKGRKPDGTDTGKGDVRLSSVAPVGLLLVVAPLGEIIAAVALGVVLAAVVIADIAVGVRNAKRAKAAENAQEPVPAYGEEAAAEGEAYFGTEVPADDGAEVASDEGEAYPGTEVPADDGAEDASDEDGMSE